MDWLFDIVIGKWNQEMQNKIIPWSGTLADIPDGWQLCDGTNETPDLRNRFIVCAEADVGGAPVATLIGAPASSGGSAQHGHPFVSDGHTHHSKNDFDVDPGTTHPVWDFYDPFDWTSFELDVGTTYDQADVSVPFYALAYIMRL